MAHSATLDFVVTYHGQTFPLDLNKRPLSEALVRKRKLGITYAEWWADFFADDPEAVQFGLWIALHRAGHPDAADGPAGLEIDEGSDWFNLADEAAALAEVEANRAAEADPTPPAEPETI